MASETWLIDVNAIPESATAISTDGRLYIAWSAIVDVPKVDAVEVVHGRWKPDLHPYDEQPYRDEWYGYMFKCSVCGATTMGDYDLLCRANYCPNCGAKMDGDLK